MGVVKVFYDQNLSYGVDGFTNVLKAKKIALKAMGENDMVLFINRSRKMYKLFWGTRYILSGRRHAGEGRLEVDDIKNIVKAFRSEILSGKYESTVKNHLGSRLQVWQDETGIQVS